MANYTDAILSLRPEALFTIVDNDYSTLNWYDEVQSKPTEEEIQAKVDELNTNYLNNQYQRDRADNYPQIGDQLDMIYHAIDSNETLKTQFADFYTAIKTIKDTYPKE